MRVRLFRSLSLVCLITLLGSTLPGGLPVLAQTGGQRYENPALGIAFDLPAGWEVSESADRLIAATPDDLTAIENGQTPQDLAVRILFGTFNELSIADATQLPELMARLVPTGITAPAPNAVEWGNASGYDILYTLPNEAVTTRLGLLAIVGGRVAVVHGFAPSAVWDGGANARFDTLAQSMTFTLPVREDDYLEDIISNDGGVFWHYQSPQPTSGRVVVAGGITYDMFDVLYMAVGPGGALAINQTTGEEIAYMGPWLNGNFTDIAIGPDTKLYMSNAGESDDAIMAIDRAGNYARSWGIRGDGDGQFAPGMPLTIAVTKGNDVWTVSEGHASGIRNRLYRFDMWGNLLLTVDLDTINPNLSRIHIDNNMDTGALYVVGATGNLNVIDTNGQPLVVNLGQEFLADVTPIDIAIAPDDNIILSLPAPGLDGFGLLKVAVSGRLLDVFGLPYDTTRGGPFLTGEYLHPAGLVVGPDGMIYFTDTNPDTGYTQIQTFLFEGDGLLPLGTEAAVEAGPVPADTSGADAAKGGGAIAYGQTVQGSLNNRFPVHQWTFDGRAGERVIITMIDASGRGLIDPKVNLLTADTRLIASNDDVGSAPPDGMAERDARLEFDLPGDGTYIIEATRFGGRGEYTLTLELGE